VKSSFCPADLQSFGGLSEAAGDKLFNQVLYNPLHVLHQLLLRQSTARQNYNLTSRKHDKELPEKNSYLTDCNFINRLLFCDLYYSCMLFPHFSFLSEQQRSVCCLINEYDNDEDDDDDDDENTIK